MNQPLIPRVAYFCMEYGLVETLPIYAGGLGMLAGDTVKAAGDLRLPVTAIGILWSEGYTSQRIDVDGMPVDAYPPTPRAGLVPTGVQVSVTIRGREVALAAFRVDIPGVAALYLLEPVDERDREVTRRLYNGDDEARVAQEIILGIGGVRLLRALHIDVDVYHFNEGHAAFAGVELIREEMLRGRSFAEAREVARRRIVFTTHTPVPAGNELHPIERLVEMGVPLGPVELAALGGDPFGMTVAGLRLSCVANGVSALHAETARAMWAHVEGAAPIEAVTNGVHPPTWQDERMRIAYAAGTLADTHQTLKRELIAEVARRTGVTFDEDRLLVGFARRAAAYKRHTLPFRDPDAVTPLLEAGRLQIVYAGKAHPHDQEGKRIVRTLVHIARRWPKSVVYLEGYDMVLGRLLTRGCDVWVAASRRPLEASGTSGMKAAMNGVLNAAVLDGWWPEACVHGVNGWCIDTEGDDDADAARLLRVLEEEILPIYGAPRWQEMMRASIEMSQWQYSSYRMIEDYYIKLYRVAARMG